MATIRLFLDTRVMRKNGTYPLKISISNIQKTAFVPLKIYLHESEWDVYAQRIINHRNKVALNAFAQQTLIDYQNALLNLSREVNTDNVSAISLRELLKNKVTPTPPTDNLFISHFTRVINRKRASTKNTYHSTLVAIKEFSNNSDTLRFEDITRVWLEDFCAFLKANGKAHNTIVTYVSKIKSVFLDAVDENITTCYPFRKFNLRLQETMKRAIPTDTLRTLFAESYKGKNELAWDVFRLIFYLIGINITDLCHLKKGNYESGYINYHRAKTGRLYIIKVEPEAAALIEKYKGRNFLLSFLEKKHTVINLATFVNKHIRNNVAGLDITTYWARHTWATIAYELDIPKETISEALGHNIGSRITNVYINFDRKKIDTANRRVLDYVLYNKKPLTSQQAENLNK